MKMFLSLAVAAAMAVFAAGCACGKTESKPECSKQQKTAVKSCCCKDKPCCSCKKPAGKKPVKRKAVKKVEQKKAAPAQKAAAPAAAPAAK